jgi:S1-C subfamily serine protease
MLLFFSCKLTSVLPIRGEIIVPILILVSIVGLSFMYVGSVSEPISSGSFTSRGGPWLGISAVEISPELSNEIGLSESSGLLVLQVAPGGPADKAGIRGGDSTKVIDGAEIPVGGDVIISIDGNAIRNLNDFRNYLGGKEVGDELRFTLVGPNNEVRNVDTILEARPA